MAITVCPYKSTDSDSFKRVCTKRQCPIWNEYLEMCSHKATSLLLFDIHQVIIGFGTSQGLIKPLEEEKEGG